MRASSLMQRARPPPRGTADIVDSAYKSTFKKRRRDKDVMMEENASQHVSAQIVPFGQRQESSEREEEKKDAGSSKGRPLYSISGNWLFKKKGEEQIPVANFWLRIASEKVVIDDGMPKGRIMDLEYHGEDGTVQNLSVSSQEFMNSGLVQRIIDEVGPEAIVLGTAKDLRVAAQGFSNRPIPTRTVTTSMGLTAEGNFLTKGALITPGGIVNEPDLEIDLNGGSFARNLGFLIPDESRLPGLGGHIVRDFLDLKCHEVTFPLIGHINLAPFTSVITEITGKRKPALHLQGPSGGGKTYLGILSMRFFGSFEDRLFSWSSTPNAIEAEGHLFRDSLFLIDDYKSASVDHNKGVRVLQGYADGHGRSRLNSSYRIQDAPHIRGLLLSTGEDFVSDVESVTGRTILLPVEADKNIEAGSRCWDRRSEYRMFLPGLIQLVLKDPNWKVCFRDFVEERILALSEATRGLSNGLRIASNWALNALGFELFLSYLLVLKVIDWHQRDDLSEEYTDIITRHLQTQAEDLQSMNPTEIFFRVIGHKLATGTAVISGMDNAQSSGRGRVLGYAKESDGMNLVYILPDSVMEALVSHFRATGQRIPLTRNTLRDALAKEGLIGRTERGRWTVQFRVPGGNGRLQGWPFDAEQFEARCGIDHAEEPIGD